MKDYYKIMGVSQNASEADIKIAYRKLARKYHPDISKEPNAEERFKEMGEAYEVLHDKKKRAEYDQMRHQESAGPRFQQHNFDFGQGHNQGSFDSDLFESLFGRARQHQGPRKGPNYQGSLHISLEEAFVGTVKPIQVPTADNKAQTIKVKVPAGMLTGQQIRLAGQGAPGAQGGVRGDIILTLVIDVHPQFDLSEKDITLTLPITPWEAALGCTLPVPTLSGSVALKIPAGSQSGQKLRITGRGLGNPAGNQYIQLKIITPKPTTAEATELYKKMAELMPFNPREPKGAYS